MIHNLSSKRASLVPHWAMVNLTLLSAVALIFPLKLFTQPIWLRNIPVVAILLLSAFNVWYVFNALSARFGFRTIGKEVVDFVSILIGTWAGTVLINLFEVSPFGAGDIKDTLLLAVVFNTVRSVISINNERANAKVKEKEAENGRLKEAIAKVQLETLQSKVAPHFLYNAMNSIAALAPVDGRKTKEMAMALSKLFRYSLNHSENAFATLREEIDVTEAYLKIEKIRFGDKLYYDLALTQGTEAFVIPRLLLQPLVENSIKHAWPRANEALFIRVEATVEKGKLVITVGDNGEPFPKNIVPGFGLKQVNDKLHLLMGERAEFAMINSPQKKAKIIVNETALQDATRK